LEFLDDQAVRQCRLGDGGEICVHAVLLILGY
jgi:hypothetical protein